MKPEIVEHLLTVVATRMNDLDSLLEENHITSEEYLEENSKLETTLQELLNYKDTLKAIG